MGAAKHTQGPWEWVIGPSGRVRLSTPDRGKLIVMDFARKGMQGAEPRFSCWGDYDGFSGTLTPVGPRERRGGVLVGLSEMADASDGRVMHPDALLIAAAPELLAAAERALELIANATGSWAIDGADEMKQLSAAIAKATGDIQ
jgi:hypothetical protein